MIKRIYISFVLLLTSLLTFAQNDFVAGDSTVFCTGYDITFVFLHNDTDSIVSYNWNFGDSVTFITNDTFALHSYDTTGIYTVTLVTVDTSGNTDTIVKQDYITIKDTTGFDFVIDSLNLPSYSFFFTATDTLGQFSWDIGGNLFTDTTYRFYYQFSAEGDYLITLKQKIAYDCVVEVSKNLKVSNELKAQNVFTPNNDGINDYFEPKVNGVDDYTLSVFNRYGEIVYEITSKRPLWDGRTPDGVECVNGIYYFILENNTDKDKVFKGFVYLFR